MRELNLLGAIVAFLAGFCGVSIGFINLYGGRLKFAGWQLMLGGINIGVAIMIIVVGATT